jgi:hypothetical protein
MTPFVTMRPALSDEHLLGAVLGGDSWLAWRILLIAAIGEVLTDEERAIFAKGGSRASGSTNCGASSAGAAANRESLRPCWFISPPWSTIAPASPAGSPTRDA